MLTIEDCIALSELTEEEVLAIAEHEHIPEICAAQLGRTLLEMPDGARRIKRMIADDIEAARAHHDLEHAASLKLALEHFVETHPEAHPEGRRGRRAG